MRVDAKSSPRFGKLNTTTAISNQAPAVRSHGRPKADSFTTKSKAKISQMAQLAVLAAKSQSGSVPQNSTARTGSTPRAATVVTRSTRGSIRRAHCRYARMRFIGSILSRDSRMSSSAPICRGRGAQPLPKGYPAGHTENDD